jgi:hypothetical protein
MGQDDEGLSIQFSALLAEAEKKGSKELVEFVAAFQKSATTQAACLTRRTILMPNAALKLLWETKGLAVSVNPLRVYFGYWRNRMAQESLNIYQEVTHYCPEVADIRKAQERLVQTLSEMVNSYDRRKS